MSSIASRLACCLLAAFSALEIGNAHAAEPLPETAIPKSGPLVRHLGPDQVLLQWETEPVVLASVEYATDGATPQRVENPKPATVHTAILTGLQPGRDYEFRITWQDRNGRVEQTPVYRFDSACDLTPIRSATFSRPFPDDRRSKAIRQTVAKIVEQSGVRRGYCLVLGCESGQMAMELALRTDLQIIAVEPDADKVEKARRLLDSIGLYGSRITVHHGPLDKLPYADRTTNLIVSERTLTTGQLPPSIEEVCRVLRPSGGVAWFALPQNTPTADVEAWLKKSPLEGWKVEQTDAETTAVLRRGPSAGSGQWTHLYADAGNSACSNDSIAGPLQIQWFGRPGPRQMVDRHHRGMGPLTVAGRLFVVGNDRLKAVDAYNGTPLWDLSIPDSRRVAVHRDCGHLAAADDRVYLATRKTCLALDAATGTWEKTFRVPTKDQPDCDWGFVAYVGDRLFGSGQKPGASYSDHNRELVDKVTHWDNVPMVTSRMLFAHDRHSGRPLWTYRPDDQIAILNSTIALGDGRLYFVESHNPAAVDELDGRVPLSIALAEGSTDLVALDQSTGQVVWRRPIDVSVWRHAIYLGHARGTLVLTGTFNESKHPRYDLRAFDSATGSPRWSSHYLRTDKGAGGSHGEQDQHPVIAGGTIYSRPVAFDLATGDRIPFNLDQSGHGCGTISASASYLFGRGANPRMYPMSESGRTSEAVTTVSRPGCWINMIPAEGLLLIPESSSGCSCAFAVQASIVLAPRGE